MININWLIPILMLVSGVFIMFRTLRISRQIFKGQETSFLKYLMSSALSGFGIFLLFVGGSLLIGLLYPDFGWTAEEKIKIIVIGIIGGILGMGGTFWQYYLTTKLREIIFKSLNRKK